MNLGTSYNDIKASVDALMKDMDVVSELHTASNRGEKVDLQKMHDLIERMDTMLVNVEKTSVLARMGGIGQMRRKMHQWQSDIEKKQREQFNNVYVPITHEDRAQSTPKA